MQTNDLPSLLSLCAKKNIRYSVFYEPDMNNQLTAIALEPTAESRKLTSNLRLALRDL